MSLRAYGGSASHLAISELVLRVHRTARQTRIRSRISRSGRHLRPTTPTSFLHDTILFQASWYLTLFRFQPTNLRVDTTL